MDISTYQKLDPLARGSLFYRAREKQKTSYQQIARTIGRSSAYIVNSVRLLALPEAVKDGLLGGLISEGHARALVSINEQKACIEIYKEVLKNHASVRQTEEFVRQKIKTGKLIINKEKIAKIKSMLKKILKKDFRGIKIKQSRKKLQIILNN